MELCVCGHNKSGHRLEWDRFRGVWDTSCRVQRWERSGRGRCRCPQFTPELVLKDSGGNDDCADV